MVVEVAASSVSEDRQMATVYGPAGIPVYWIVNLKARAGRGLYALEAAGGCSAMASPASSRRGSPCRW